MPDESDRPVDGEPTDDPESPDTDSDRESPVDDADLDGDTDDANGAGEADDTSEPNDGDDETGDVDDTETDSGPTETDPAEDLDDFPSARPEPVDLASKEGSEPDETAETDGEDDSPSARERLEAQTDSAPSAEEEREAQTDGEGYVHDQGAGGGSYEDEGLGGISTPPDDQEMPLADHIEEMVLRVAAVFLIGATATVIGLLGASVAVDYIWQNVLPVALEAPPHVYHPLELWLTRIKVAALLGILFALPMFVYQCYLFMRPGLYPNERKYYLSAVPMSLVLAVVGMYVSFVLVLPVLFQYFTFYSEGSAGIAYALGETFNLIITLTGFMAIVFQIPLFIMLAIMMGVTTRQWLAEKRLYFWAAFFGLSFMFTIDPTLMAPIIVALIMIVLFEGSLLLLRWTGQE